MKKSDLDRLARNPKFIPGIYNYCDRWCERCAFTARCMNFSMQREEDRQSGGGPPRDRAEFWKRFEASLKLTKEMLVDMARERGVTFDPAELEEIGREEERKRRAAEKHPIAKAGMKYVKLVDQWFKQGEAALRDKEEEILAQAKLGVTKVKEEVASLTDVVEILRWYQHQIYVKLMRGLNTNQEYEATSAFPRDSDGSVKVALIAMDRSIAAWLRMKEFFPDKTDSILTLLVHLDRLRRAAEKEFPDARKFVRPGFDTGESPK
jgi:hypothetical protein